VAKASAAQRQRQTAGEIGTSLVHHFAISPTWHPFASVASLQRMPRISGLTSAIADIKDSARP